MDNLLLSAEIMLPQLIWMATGYFARLTLRLDDSFVDIANKLLFRILLPVMLFKNLADGDLSSIWNKDTVVLIGIASLMLCISVAVLLWIVPRLEREDNRRGVIIQGVFRSNTAIYGIPIALSLYGDGNIALVTLLVAALVPIFNILSVVVLEIYKGGQLKLLPVLRSIVSNPLIIGLVIGMLYNQSGLILPDAVNHSITGLANTATPIAFLLLGASFTFSSAAKNMHALLAIVIAKLLLMPLIPISLGAYLGYREQALLAILVIFAPPTAVSSVSMASAVGGDVRLSGEIVVFTSVCSLFTMFLWIFALKSFMLIG